MKNVKIRRLGLVLVMVMAVFVMAMGGMVFADGGESAPAPSFGIFSLLPPLIAIILCLVTKEVLPSLFIGIWVAATMMAGGNPVSGFGKTVEMLWTNLGDPWGARIVLTGLAMGGLVGIMWVGGGIDAVVQWITSKIKSRKGALLATELAGFIVFYEDYVNTLVVGTAMSPITADYRISKEKLSYIVDATAAPIACIALVSSWIAYMTGQIGAQFDALGITYSTYGAYVKSIPYIFYNIVALILLTYVIWSGRDYGPMLAAERRAISTGKILRDGAQPLSATKMDEELTPSDQCPRRLINFFIPIGSLVCLILFLMLKTGGWPEVSITAAIADAGTSVALCWGSFGALFITIVLYRIQNLASTSKIFKGCMEGMRAIVYGTLILIFAWSIGSAIKEVGTAKFIVSITQGVISPGVIPLITFIVASMISFSTGTTYGTIAVMMPIVLPMIHESSMAAAIDPMTFLFATIGAVFGGSVFGDHCSPISDTTIMSSMFTGSDHMDHVNTQIPYALMGAAGAAMGYVGVAMGLPVLVNLILASGVTLVLFRVMSKPIDMELVQQEEKG
ncbi:Na+/H+ antiporter NhaC family protein [Anaerosolibacter sp.]|uniref:Na+/H+ antiporter NhaC family protein n=1 Tax=Anaerosolibacter sp. TaxID=1872527 RepID=UPI0039EEDDD6